MRVTLCGYVGTVQPSTCILNGPSNSGRSSYESVHHLREDYTTRVPETLNPRTHTPTLEMGEKNACTRDRKIVGNIQHKLQPLCQVRINTYLILLRGTTLNRTYGTHKNLYISLFLLTTFGPVYYGPPWYCNNTAALTRAVLTLYILEKPILQS